MEKKKRKWMKKSLLKRYKFSHDNSLRAKEISLLLVYKVYLQMFLFISGKIFDMITSLIQKKKHDYGRLLCTTWSQTVHCQHFCTTSVVQTV